MLELGLYSCTESALQCKRPHQKHTVISIKAEYIYCLPLLYPHVFDRY